MSSVNFGTVNTCLTLIHISDILYGQRQTTHIGGIMLTLDRPEVRGRMFRLFETQAEFAAAIGVSRTWMSSLMSGKEEPSTHVLLSMTQILDCKIDDIVKYPETETA